MENTKKIESDIGVLEVLSLPDDWAVVYWLRSDKTDYEINGCDLVGVDAVRVRLFDKIELRCSKTNNICGTDTWPKKDPCLCNNCRKYLVEHQEDLSNEYNKFKEK